MIRPSGTEPKCKIYVDLRTDLPDGADRTKLAELEADLLDVADRVGHDLARFVGLED
jgi:phosphomannomutase